MSLLQTAAWLLFGSDTTQNEDAVLVQRSTVNDFSEPKTHTFKPIRRSNLTDFVLAHKITISARCFNPLHVFSTYGIISPHNPTKRNKYDETQSCVLFFYFTTHAILCHHEVHTKAFLSSFCELRRPAESTSGHNLHRG